MSTDLTPEVNDRLTAGHYGWLTTVAKSGQPVRDEAGEVAGDAGHFFNPSVCVDFSFSRPVCSGDEITMSRIQKAVCRVTGGDDG
jgi:hypothetical protein